MSLIEFMIAITLGLVILAAVGTLFVNQNKTRTDLDKANRLIENGRYALEVLSENLKLAGFYGELDPSSVALPASVADPCTTPTAANLTEMVRLHIQGYNAAGTSASIASPPCSLVTGTSLKAGSDILVLRRASTATPIAQSSLDAANTTFYLQASLCQYDTSTTYKVDQVPNNFTLRQRNCTTTSTCTALTPCADVRPYFVQIYYIAPNNVSGDGIPTLKRIELTSAGTFSTVALVEGIEHMQFDYGVDDRSSTGVIGTTRDGVVDAWTSNPDTYAPGGVPAGCTAANAACNWSNVVAIKVNLLARNVDTTSGHSNSRVYAIGLDGSFTAPGDAYKRHVYSQVIRLVNPAGRREGT